MNETVTLTRYAMAYGAALLVMGVLDALWLGWVAKDFYAQHMAGHRAESVQLLPAALFYFGYPVGLVFLALYPLPESMAGAVLRAAVVGLTAYGVYDLTNLATLRDWSARMAAVDAVWGGCASAVAGAAAYWVLRRG
ncbi:MAG: DUF2177 family protein [Rubrivivax sp.]